MNSHRTRSFAALTLALSLVRGYAAAHQGKSVNVTKCVTLVASEYYEPAAGTMSDLGISSPGLSENFDTLIV